MKVMIAYDGSAYADAALDDLRRAGLPREAEALIVSVGDGLVSAYTPLTEVAGTALMSGRVFPAIVVAKEQAVRLLSEAREFATRARARLLSFFPEWEVRTKVLEGSPSREVLRIAERWMPNLIVVGSQGRSTLGRFFLGSVSKAVATSARCSVRIGRRVSETEGGTPLRLVVGVDGSPGARWVVRAVGVREWPEGTEARIVVVDDGSGPPMVTGVRPRLEELLTVRGDDEPVSALLMAEGARAVLAAKGLCVSVEVREGDPRRVLMDEARAHAADALFVGSHGLTHLGEVSGLGSVAGALVTDAASTVEVVRPDGLRRRGGGD